MNERTGVHMWCVLCVCACMRAFCASEQPKNNATTKPNIKRSKCSCLHRGLHVLVDLKQSIQAVGHNADGAILQIVIVRKREVWADADQRG